MATRTNNITMDDLVTEAQKMPSKAGANQLQTLATPPAAPGALPVITPQAGAVPPIQPITMPTGTPTLEQFTAPRVDLTKQLFGAQSEQILQGVERGADILSQKLFGQNVAPEGGIGQTNIEDFLTELQEKLTPIGKELTAEQGLQAITDFNRALESKGLSPLGGKTLEAIKFEKEFGLGERQFTFEQDKFRSELGFEEDKFNQALAFDKDMFEKEYGFEKDKFEKLLDFDKETFYETLAFDEDKFAQEFGFERDKFDQVMNFDREQFETEQTRLDFDLVLDGTITGDAADEILTAMGIDNISDLNIPDKREQLIQNMVESFIANDKPIDWDKLNEWLVALGQDPIDNAEIVESGGGFTSLSGNLLSSDWQDDNGFVRGDLKRFKDDYGFEIDTRKRSRRVDTGFLTTKLQYRAGIADTEANEDLFRNLYDTDADFRALADSLI